jgi:hypothetical protein
VAKQPGLDHKQQLKMIFGVNLNARLDGGHDGAERLRDEMFLSAVIEHTRIECDGVNITKHNGLVTS